MTISDTIKSLTQTAESRARVFGNDDSSVKHALAMLACIEAREAKLERVSVALRDALSTFGEEDGKETLVTAERQEAWIAALNS